MVVNLRVSSLGWLGVGSCRGFKGKVRLCGYRCGYFMANGEARGCSFGIRVANMRSASRDMLQAGLESRIRIDSLQMTGLTLRKKKHSKQSILWLR